MKVKKILNNNTVIVSGSLGHESILMGKGIAFGKKVGDPVDKDKVERVFSPKEKGAVEKLSHLIGTVPMAHVNVCDEIYNMACQELNGQLSGKVLMTLIDHISFAIQRHQNGMDLSSGLMWEMKNIYPEEYQTALKALDILDKRLDIRFPEEEAAFIAFHFVNAGTASNTDVRDSVALVKEILQIVAEELNIQYDQDSYAYNRFLTHLKYFTRRLFRVGTDKTANGQDTVLYDRFLQELPKESECIDKIANHIYTKYGHKIEGSERSYLIVHLHSLQTRR